MRYLTDDGKVFNTAEECKEYEEALKERDRLSQEEKELKKRNEDLKKISDKYDKILEQVGNITRELNEYKRKYGKSNISSSEVKAHSHNSIEDDASFSLADLLLDYFG